MFFRNIGWLFNDIGYNLVFGLAGFLDMIDINRYQSTSAQRLFTFHSQQIAVSLFFNASVNTLLIENVRVSETGKYEKGIRIFTNTF